MVDKINQMQEDGFGIASSMQSEQKYMNLSGIDIVFGPVPTDPAGKSIIYQLYLPNVDDTLAQTIDLPNDSAIQRQILDSLTNLAKEAGQNPNRLYDSLSNLINKLTHSE